jgi:hypothetical protein
MGTLQKKIHKNSVVEQWLQEKEDQWQQVRKKKPNNKKTNNAA